MTVSQFVMDKSLETIYKSLTAQDVKNYLSVVIII